MKRGTEWIIGAVIGAVFLAAIMHREQERDRKETEEAIKKTDDILKSAMDDLCKASRIGQFVGQTYSDTRKDQEEIEETLKRLDHLNELSDLLYKEEMKLLDDRIENLKRPSDGSYSETENLNLEKYLKAFDRFEEEVRKFDELNKKRFS